MDALMAALVAAALAGIGDKPAWLAAILADRYRRPAMVIAAAVPALILANALAALGGWWLAPRFTPEAKLLMLAVATVLLGAGALGRARAPDRLEGWRIGGVATAMLGLFILMFGEGVPFLVTTLAARSPLPWLTPAGATAGSLAVIAVAAMLGERGWTALPLARVRFGAAILFLVVGAVLALQALALI